MVINSFDIVDVSLQTKAELTIKKFKILFKVALLNKGDT
jgi:hypothetical protein